MNESLVGKNRPIQSPPSTSPIPSLPLLAWGLAGILWGCDGNKKKYTFSYTAGGQQFTVGEHWLNNTIRALLGGQNHSWFKWAFKTNYNSLLSFKGTQILSIFKRLPSDQRFPQSLVNVDIQLGEVWYLHGWLTSQEICQNFPAAKMKSWLVAACLGLGLAPLSTANRSFPFGNIL